MLFDRYGSPDASATWMQTTRFWFNHLEDQYVLSTQPNIGLRWLSNVYNNLTNDLLMLAQHEACGHGFRWRSYGYPVDGYSIFPLFFFIPAFVAPMNGLGAATHTKSYTDQLIGPDQILLVDIAGNEANTILAHELIKTHFEQGYLDHRTYNLFFKAFTNLLGYILISTDQGMQGTDIGVKGDIDAYIDCINQKHGVNKIQLNELKKASFIYFLNPMLYTSIWSFYSYLFQGIQQTTIPRITWNNYAYMPIIRPGLTPFGLAYYLDNYLAIGKQVFSLGFNLGKSPFYTKYYGGCMLQTNNLWTYKNYTLDLTAGMWYQPGLVFQPHSFPKDQNNWGGLLGINNRLRVSKSLSVLANIFYKTDGFVEGVVADAGWRFGVGVAIDY